ncbi:MAG: hypothetical protein JO047_09630 [Alphaproteobacteria bacterium]|nr:hypothetical protein [Alphaproteobacteria bacterium]
MRKSLLFCWIAALPLAACATDGGIARGNQPTAVADTAAPGNAVQPVAYAPSGPPVAVLVVMPGGGALAGVPPALWADQGFDVIAPRMTDAMLAEERSADAALGQMLTYARAMASAPIWLVGSGPEIQAALERLPAGEHVSGVVMTSVSTPAGTCSRTVVYGSAGNGAQPTVQVRSSGDACGPDISPSVRPPVFEQVPQPAPSRQPRTILVRADQPAHGAVAQARSNPLPLVRQVADRIKQAPQG